MTPGLIADAIFSGHLAVETLKSMKLKLSAPCICARCPALNKDQKGG